MFKSFLLSASVIVFGVCNATVHANIFSTPMVLINSDHSIPDNGRTLNLYIQDSVDYFQFAIATNLAFHNICFTESFPDYYTETDDAGNAAIHSCSGVLNSDSLHWHQEATLAVDSADANFDGKGPHYLGIKRKYQGGYEFGWIKLSCSITGDTLTVYGYGYNDELSTTPNIISGEGECVNGISEIYLPDVSVKCANGIIQVSYSQPLQINMFDVQGKLVQQLPFNGGDASYNCTQLAHGIYMLQLGLHNQERLLKIVL